MSSTVDRLKAQLNAWLRFDNQDRGHGIDRIKSTRLQAIFTFIDEESPKILKKYLEKARITGKINEPRALEEVFESIMHFFTSWNETPGIARSMSRTDTGLPHGGWENSDTYYIKPSDIEGTADHFIYKDLKAVLWHELDAFIKDSVLHIDHLDECNDLSILLARVKCLQEIMFKIIDDLAAIETVQKRLWEKKKFVISTDYLVTLDYIDENLYPEILGNEAQLCAWRDHFGIDLGKSHSVQDRAPDGTDTRMDVLKQNPTLSIDTRFFPVEFKYKILEGIDDLEVSVTGVLINSDNFHALKLLIPRLDNTIKCCYIDPPYNARTSDITYKNDYEERAWLNLISSRLMLVKDLLHGEGGILVVAIDENEQERLGLLLDSIFQDHEKTCVAVVHNAAGIQGKNFSYCHEYAYFVFPKGKELIGTRVVDDAPVTPLRDWGKATSLRTAAKTCFYPIIIKEGTIAGFGDVCDKEFHPACPNVVQPDGSVWIYPIDGNNVERKWRFSRNEVESIRDELFCKQKGGEWSIYRKKINFRYKTVWNDAKYYANVYGSKLLGDILGSRVFTFPKSPFLVKDCLHATTQKDPHALILDFFAGSGTTGHAVMKLNKEDNGKRHFILVEMGEHFNSVLKPRIQKVIYSDAWSKGKPRNNQGSKKQVVKYHVLEQYDDALGNITIQDPSIMSIKPRDHGIAYMVDLESQDGNVRLYFDSLDDPFSCKMNIGSREAVVDVMETFNYIAGISPRSLKRAWNGTRLYVIITGSRKEKRVVEIWRNCEGDFLLERDKEFIEHDILVGEYEEVFVNGKCLVKNVIFIEEYLENHMFDSE